ncbi:MAG TPA: CmpA/NrtA family ABC transporter substrate-binding protein [Phenylobacterium sp.]|nr:CmpA/NrtA family ABC transporter substrate-binding protein [Phenylobacterium sp.]
MSRQVLKLGFVPLLDAAGLVVAEAQGFFAAEGLEVELVREASWATIRDKVAVGALDGAHMLAPMPLAMTLGAAGEPIEMVAPIMLGAGGATITVARRLGLGGDLGADRLAGLVARRREAEASRLTFGVVFPFSTHNYLLRLWMAQAGLDPDRDVRITVAPPPRMAELLAAGVVEGFCAGQPWSAAAVAAGAGEIAARAADIAPGAPDKVFAVTRAFAEGRAEVLPPLLRALDRALAWAEAGENRPALAELLARRNYVGVAAEVVAEGLAGLVFHRSGARPDPMQALWVLDQMVRWRQVAPPGDAFALAERVLDPSLYDAAVA